MSSSTRHRRLMPAVLLGAFGLAALGVAGTAGSAVTGSSGGLEVAGISQTRTAPTAPQAMHVMAVTTVPVTTVPVTTVPVTTVPVTTVPVTTVPITASHSTSATRGALRDAVLARLALRVNEMLPGWRIEFLAPRPGYRGSTFPAPRRIEIYPQVGESFDELVHITAHEIGHAVDVTYLDNAGRARFAASRGRGIDSPWWVVDGADDFESGAGDWAECFAWLETRHGPWFSQLGPPPNATQLGVMRELVP